MTSFRSLIVGSLILAGLTASAMAADAPRGRAPVAFEPTPAAGWIVTVTGNVIAGPRWDGADSLGVAGYPSLSFRRAGTQPKWKSPDDGISFSLLDTGIVEIGPVARIRSGRYNGSDWRLAGIHDVKWTVEPGVFANLWLAPNVRARAEIRHGFRGQDGFHANFGLDWVNTFDAWTFAIGPRLELADSKFMQTNFGVTPVDAFLNRSVWANRPDGGIKSYGVYSSLGYRFNESWSATLHGGFNKLGSEPSASPIIRRHGSSNQGIIGLQIAYSFPMQGF